MRFHIDTWRILRAAGSRYATVAQSRVVEKTRTIGQSDSHLRSRTRGVLICCKFHFFTELRGKTTGHSDSRSDSLFRIISTYCYPR